MVVGNESLEQGSATTLNGTERIITGACLYVSLLLNICLICATTWILMCLMAHAYRTRKWYKVSSRKDLNGGKIFIMCLITVAMTLPRYVVTQIIIQSPKLPDGVSKCEILMDISVFCGCLPVYLTYFFLWLRQRAIYVQPVVMAITGERWVKISWMILLGLTIMSILLLCGFTVPSNYASAEYGCVRKQNKSADWWGSSAFYVLGGLSLFWQIALLVVFIHPMIRMRQSQSRRQGSIRMRASDKISKTIIRSVICAAVTIVSDVSAAVVRSLMLGWNLPAILSTTIYDVNLFINLLCVISTFGKNRKFLTSFITCKAVAVSPSSKQRGEDVSLSKCERQS